MKMFILLVAIASVLFSFSECSHVKHLPSLSHSPHPPHSHPPHSPHPPRSPHSPPRHSPSLSTPPPSLSTPPYSPSPPSLSTNLFSVLSYGAVGDGIHDDAQAFLRAYSDACRVGNAVLRVPPSSGGYYLSPITFGHCSGVTMLVEATLIAIPRSEWLANYPSVKTWIEFSKVTDFKLVGGTFDGRGEDWWKHSCKTDKSQPCSDAPTAVKFSNSKNVEVRGTVVTQSPQIHLTFSMSDSVLATNVVINSPGNSPNTDGIHVSATTNVVISKADISAGDDCVSIVSGSSKIEVLDSRCGPGHGISIGSLGKNKNEFATVSDVQVSGIQIDGATNGVRIKTWQGGQGLVHNVVFKDIVMNDVKNPIIIDQNYCNGGHQCSQLGSSLSIDEVLYSHITGTSASPQGISLECNAKTGCTNIHLDDVHLTLTKTGKPAGVICSNIRGYSSNCEYDRLT